MDGIEVVVFDVLGTLVDEPAGLRAGIRAASPGLGDVEVEGLLAIWQDHVALQQRRMAQGERPYADTDVVDAEAAGRVADRAGVADRQVVARLATAGHRLPPWPDSVAVLDRLASRFPVIGLSNASDAALLDLSRSAGLRWHQVLSSEAVRAYKPAPAVYRRAVAVAGRSPDRILMVAAHAWDLRAARAAGMRTAHVDRPVADPPLDTDAFDARFRGLAELADALESGSLRSDPIRC